MMELNDVREQLAAPIVCKWKPEITTKKGPNNTRVNIERNGQRVAGCTAHIDARDVMDRLDEVVGPGNWSDSYQPSAIGQGVECTLTVLGVSKTDVGMPSSQDAEKGAYSDALKRAAVKFGVGRFLYDMEIQWLPFDGFKVISQTEQKPAQAPPPETKKPATNGNLPPSHLIADLRATIEGAGDSVELGFVNHRLVDTGLYNAAPHAFNAVKKWDGWPEDGKYSAAELNGGSKITVKKALAIFDWAVDRKVEETK